MKGRILALLLAVCMLVSLMPTALAAEETGATEVSVTDEAQLIDAVNNGGTITLANDIDLTDTLEIPAGVTVDLDLNGFTLNQTGTKTRYHDARDENGEIIYDDYGDPVQEEYMGPLNGISNYGTLTIGGGTVTGTYYEAEAKNEEAVKKDNAWNCIYNAGTLTVKDGTYKARNQGIYNGDSYYDEFGELTINGGTFVVEDWSGVYNNYGHITVNGGDFTARGDCSIDNETGDPDDATIAGGNYASEFFFNCAITGGTFGSDCSITGDGGKIVGGTFNGCSIGGGLISGGEFIGLRRFSATIAEDAEVEINLKDAYIGKTITRGTFSGTVSDIYHAIHFRGGTYTKELKESLEALGSKFKFEAGYNFVEDPVAKTFTVTNVGTVKFNVASSSTEDGTVSVTHYEHNGSSSSTTTGVMSEQTVTKGGTITLTATATPTEGHELAGWFTNKEGTGTPVAPAKNLENFVHTVNDADGDGAETLYAVFRDSAEQSELESHVDAWLAEAAASADGKTYIIGSADDTASDATDGVDYDAIADMYAFAYAVNHMGKTFAGDTVILKADLDYTNSASDARIHSFIPVGSDAVMFAGTFEGGGHTISGITLEGGFDQMGIFGHLAGGGTVRNLNVDHCSFSAAHVGGIAAWSEGTITNCSVTNCTLQSGYGYCGGIVGHDVGGRLENVVSTGNKIGGWKYGGIVGYADLLHIYGAAVSDMTLLGPGLGALLGSHVNAGESILENVKASDDHSEETALIGTTYSSGTKIVIQGTDTDINVSTIVPDTAGLETLTIKEGTCHLSGPMVIEDETTLKLTNDVTVTTSNNEPFAELKPGAMVEKTEDDGTVVTVETAADGEVDAYGNLILPVGSTVTTKASAEAESQPTTTLEHATVVLPNGTVVQGSATEAPTVSKNESGEVVVTAPAGGSVKELGQPKVELPAGGSATTNTVGGAETAVVVKVSGVSLDPEALSMVQGSTAALTAAVEPAGATHKAVTWVSSNNAVVTVTGTEESNATITAAGEGEATITVTTTDGGKTASCAVTVAAKPAEGSAAVLPIVEETKTSVDPAISAGEDQTAAGAAASSVTLDDAIITEAAQEQAVDLNQDEAKKQELLDEANLTPADDEAVTLYTQTYLKVEATELTKENSAITSITLDITPMVQVVASTATTSAEIDTTGADANAVNVGAAKPLKITAPTQITVTLPQVFANEKIYVKHEAGETDTYYYNATADGDGQITFTSTHGFSPFTFSLSNGAVAEVDGVGYTTLQEAVDAAGDGDTVKVYESGLTATVSGASRSVNVANGTDGEITVTLNGREYTIAQGDTVAHSYSQPVSAPTTYAITVPAQVDGGAIQVSRARAAWNATVTVTVTPGQGYELDTLTVTSSYGSAVKLTDKGDGTFTFRMPASRVTVQVSFKELPEEVNNPFTDVLESSPYYEAVMWAVENGVTNGSSPTTFSPDTIVSRAQMVTFLWRACGSPKATVDNCHFTDVHPGAYYYDAVLWAVSSGVTNGTSGTTFSPDVSVTRAQAVTFQWRIAGSPVVSGNSLGDVAANTYYTNAANWAVSNGIAIGTDGSSFDPETPISRAQAVTFLYQQKMNDNREQTGNNQ